MASLSDAIKKVSYTLLFLVSFTNQKVALFYLKSEDGDQGFPGTLEIEVLVQLKGKDFTIAYRATQDGAEVTPISEHLNLSTLPY